MQAQNGVRENAFPWDFPGGSVIKNSPSNAGDVGSIPGGELGSLMPHGN